MTKSRVILTGPLLLSLLAVAFCLWTALGNEVNICVTAGCSLYQDFTVFGVSLWWYGTVAFSLLAICALLGLRLFGRRLAALFLLGDVVLLLLMLLTAPCVNCLIVAALFCLVYLSFRGASSLSAKNEPEKRAIPVIIWCWLAFFVINLGAVARTQMAIWPILDESGEGRGRMFFSPSCVHCVEGIKYFSGKVYMAFYPVAENDSDIYRIARMRELLDQGMNLAEALAQSEEFTEPGFFSSLQPEFLILRFRLLINRAHVLSAGSPGVPFFEYLGLPPETRKLIEDHASGTRSSKARTSPEETEPDRSFRDPSLPIELGGQCGGMTPCPPAN